MNAPVGWHVRRFDELGTIWSGSTPSSNNSEFWDGDVVWITPTDLSRLNTPYIHDSAKRITERGLAGCSTHLLPPGSVVLSSRAPIGYIAIPTTAFCTNQGCKSIELNDAFNSEFVYYGINFIVGDVKRLGEGTTFAEISKKALAGVELIAPNHYTEQSKIAEVLSTVDRAIAQTEALITKQQRIKTGLMQDLLTRGIDEHGQLRSEATHAFKDSPLGRIPVEWEVTTVAQAAADERHSFIDGDWIEAPFITTTGIRLIQTGNIGVGTFIDRNKKYISSESFNLLKCKDVLAGDILICRLADPIGRSCIVPDLGSRAITSVDVCILRVASTKYDRDFIAQVLNQATFLAACEEKSGGSTRQRISRINLGAVQIAVAKNKAEQSDIARILSEADVVIQRKQAVLDKLRSFKTALMQDLLTGKVRVTPLLEPAEEATT